MSAARCAGCDGPVDQVGETCSTECYNEAASIAGAPPRYDVPEEYMPWLLSQEDPEQLLERVSKVWDLDGPLPFPRRPQSPLHCGACGGRKLLIRYWRFHAYENDAEKTWPYRCDVWMKCWRCSHTWPHGIAVPKEMWEQRGLRVVVKARDALMGDIWEREQDPKIEALMQRWREANGFDAE